MQDSPAFKAALDEAVIAVTAEEGQLVQPALAQPQEEKQQALSSASQGKAVTRRAVARAIANSKLDKKEKVTALESLSVSRNDQIAVLAYQHRCTSTYQFDFNLRMRERRKQRLVQESMESDTFDVGLSSVDSDNSIDNVTNV